MKKSLWVLLLGTGMLLAATPFGGKIILLDANATDLAYNMPLKKYEKWLAEAELENGQKKQFVSVKAMMQVYFHQPFFIKHGLLSAPIRNIYVQDWLSGKRIEAKKAYYVFGSRLVGPHGDDLIPFESEANAKRFIAEHGGTKILPFTRLSKTLIRYLDT